MSMKKVREESLQERNEEKSVEFPSQAFAGNDCTK
jgi:hypothetical protein